MNTTLTDTKTRIRKCIASVVIAAATFTAGSGAAAQTDRAPSDRCAGDRSLAADVGGILPVNFVPPPEMQAALRGEIAVGAGCSTVDPPDWTQCAYRHLPVAAGVGGILPVNFVAPTDLRDALLGETAVGTDCSIYDLPV